MSSDYWTVRKAVELAANIWYSKELLDINALTVSNSTGFRHKKPSLPSANARTSGGRVFYEERIRPKKITLKIRDVHSDDEWDPDPLPEESTADTREIEDQSEAETRRREAESRAREIRNEVWLELKNDLGSGKLRASALPCQQTPPFHPNCTNPIDVIPSFWERKGLSESSLDKPHRFGINSRHHLVLISKEELRKYLHPEKLPTQVTSAGSKAEQNKDKVDGNGNDGNLGLTRAENVGLNAKPRRRSGRKPTYDWDKIEAEANSLLDYHGGISSDDDELNSQARLVEALQDFYQKTFGSEPSDSSLKAKVPKWLAKWRAGKGAVGN